MSLSIFWPMETHFSHNR